MKTANKISIFIAYACTKYLVIIVYVSFEKKELSTIPLSVFQL